jgi:hypothetical protein
MSHTAQVSIHRNHAILLLAGCTRADLSPSGDFKWNTRKISNGERPALAMKGLEGMRLTYRITH